MPLASNQPTEKRTMASYFTKPQEVKKLEAQKQSEEETLAALHYERQIAFSAIINRRKEQMPEEDRNKIWTFVSTDGSATKHMKREDRCLLWLQCSGAMHRLKTHPSYYKSLKVVDLKYPHPAP